VLKEDNILFDLEEMGCEGMDWIDLAHERDEWCNGVKAEMKINNKLNAGQ